MRSSAGWLRKPTAVRHLRLPPLSEAAVAELARRAGRPAAGLRALTGGNPLLVTGVLAAGDAGVPLTVRDLVLAHADRLPRRSGPSCWSATRSRPICQGWELGSGLALAVVLAVALLSVTFRVNQPDGSDQVREFTFGMGAAAGLLVMVDFAAKLLGSRGRRVGGSSTRSPGSWPWPGALRSPTVCCSAVGGPLPSSSPVLTSSAVTTASISSASTSPGDQTRGCVA